MEYYSTTRKHEALSFAATWKKLEGITLSKISHKKDYKHHMILLIGSIERNKVRDSQYSLKTLYCDNRTESYLRLQRKKASLAWLKDMAFW